MKRLLLIVLCLAMLGSVATTAQGAAGAPPGNPSVSPQPALPAKVRAAIADRSKAKVMKHRSVRARRRIARQGRALLKRLEAQQAPAKPRLSKGSNRKGQARASYHCYFDYCGTAYYGGGYAGDFFHGGYAYGDPYFVVYFSYYGNYCFYSGGYYYYYYDYYYRGQYYGTYYGYC